MKRLFIKLLSFTILCIMAISFQSCGEEKYTVWTETSSYAEFQQTFQTTLNDGYYIRNELSNDFWKDICKDLPSDGKHSWTEETIKKWLISNGFGESEARKESSWLVLVNHGFIVVRDRNLVYMILK